MHWRKPWSHRQQSLACSGRCLPFQLRLSRPALPLPPAAGTVLFPDTSRGTVLFPDTSLWTVLFQAPAAGQCSSRHQPRDSALPGTGILHLLLSRARKVLSSFLRYGNPLRPPDLITPLCAGAHALQSPFTGCEAETVSNACLAILPQQGLPVVQLPHL